LIWETDIGEMNKAENFLLSVNIILHYYPCRYFVEVNNNKNNNKKQPAVNNIFKSSNDFVAFVKL
jgi:hypothetical protein